jgi:hypothetical protein
LRDYHAEQVSEARRIYVEGLITPAAADDWYRAKAESRHQIMRALRASLVLQDFEAALAESGRHMAVFRHLLAPPMSQDQFALLCPQYPKRNEGTGRGLSVEAGSAVADVIRAGIDRQLAPWLWRNLKPTYRQIRRVVEVLAPLLSQQTAATLRRNRLSASQEGAVVTLLRRKGWEQQGSAPISALDGIQRRHFMHKTKFATKT